MIQCAQDLARTRFPGQNVTYFIATDNPILKEQLMMDQQTTNHAPTMFTTHVLPYSFETTGKRGGRHVGITIAGREGRPRYE